MLDDGTYDAIVFDADDIEGGGVTVELAVLAGERKGEVISVASSAWAGDALDLLGVPATITVVDGRPSVTFEP